MLPIEEKILEKRSLYITGYEGDLNLIDQEINTVLKNDMGRVISNLGGYQSNDITQGFDHLCDYIQHAIEKIFSSKKYKLGNFWLNINKGSDHNVLHVHNTKTLSVVYYHKICCDKCPIVFEHFIPSMFGEHHYFYPNNQSIIFFHGLTPHKVLACNQENHERVSIAFNFNEI